MGVCFTGCKFHCHCKTLFSDFCLIYVLPFSMGVLPNGTLTIFFFFFLFIGFILIYRPPPRLVLYYSICGGKHNFPSPGLWFTTGRISFFKLIFIKNLPRNKV